LKSNFALVRRGALFDVFSSHSVGEAVLKSGFNALEVLVRRGLSQAIKSDFAKKKIKNFASKYLDQALDNITSDITKKKKMAVLLIFTKPLVNNLNPKVDGQQHSTNIWVDTVHLKNS